jgi:hypothetical protein
MELYRREITPVYRYIELKTGYADNRAVWIGHAASSKNGRTLYFNGRGLRRLKGQLQGDSGGNQVDVETGLA